VLVALKVSAGSSLDFAFKEIYLHFLQEIIGSIVLGLYVHCTVTVIKLTPLEKTKKFCKNAHQNIISFF
jgi:hypothetical protein